VELSELGFFGGRLQADLLSELGFFGGRLQADLPSERPHRGWQLLSDELLPLPLLPLRRDTEGLAFVFPHTDAEASLVLTEMTHPAQLPEAACA